MLNDYHTLFSWFNMLALLGWALLMLSPKRWNWVLITTGIVIPGIFGLVYGALMLTHFSSVEGGGYASMTQVKALFGSEPVLLAGWLHYLCFDLLIGTWIAREADQLRISRLVQLPILFSTFYFGPAGLVVFFMVKSGWQTLSAQSERKTVNHVSVAEEGA